MMRRLLAMLSVLCAFAAGGAVLAAAAAAQSVEDGAPVPAEESGAESPSMTSSDPDPPPSESAEPLVPLPSAEPSGDPAGSPPVEVPEPAPGPGYPLPEGEAGDSGRPAVRESRTAAFAFASLEAKPRRGGPTGGGDEASPPELDQVVICAQAQNLGRCNSGVAQLIAVCTSEPDPDACGLAVAGHACIQAPRSIECFAYLRPPCGAAQSSECLRKAGIREVYCSFGGDPTFCFFGPVCCSDEPVGPDGGLFVGTQAQQSGPGDPPEELGIADPGAIGDRGQEARPPTRRFDGAGHRRLPFTGMPLLAMAALGAMVSAAGFGLGRRRSRPASPRC